MTYDEVVEYAEENNLLIPIFDNPKFPNSILGISYDNRVIYDMEQMITDLMGEDDISYIDALEFIEYNTLRIIPYMGENAPIILYTKEF